MKPTLTHEQLLFYLSYNADTGEFRWRNKPARRIMVGSIAGRMNKGYRVIRLFTKEYAAGRVAWFYTYGHWPSGEVDHINHVRDDNRLVNLRDVSPSQNSCNQPLKRNNRVGLKGVQLSADGKKYTAKIILRGERRHLGTFATPEEAHAAYCKAAQALHGEFACAG